MTFFRNLLLIALLFFFSSFSYAYEKVPVTISFKEGGELYTYFYCFNDFSEGKKIAEEIFHLQKYDELAAGKREKVIPVPLGTKVGYFNWSIFCYGDELWLFENKNGYLWGRGSLMGKPRDL